MKRQSTLRSVGLVLHPNRDCESAVAAIVEWAARSGRQIFCTSEAFSRLGGQGNQVPDEELAQRADMLISLGGDGTMLRALRLADRPGTPVLGVNLGKLGFLAEIDVDQVGEALVLLDAGDYAVEPRLALDVVLSGQQLSAFNDIVIVRMPGGHMAEIVVEVDGRPFVSYAADAVIVATSTGSTAYSFSAGGPLVSPNVEGVLVTPVAPHSTFNRGIVLCVDDPLALGLLPGSGSLAVEVDGAVAGQIEPGDRLAIGSHTSAAGVVRFGQRTFYERARRKLGITDSPELRGRTTGPT